MAYQQGKLRGVPFFCEEAEGSFGRKTAIYPLPFESRGVASVDMGRAPREFTFKAIYVGANYAAQRDALISALETPGPMKLEHPYLDKAVLVVLKSPARIRETTAEGRKCEITLELIEERGSNEPVPSNDLAAFTKTKAATLREVGAAYVGRGFSVDGTPDFVAEAHLEMLDVVLDELRDLNNLIGSALAVPSHFAAQIDSIASELATLINTPTTLYNTIDFTIASIYQSIRKVKGSSTKQLGNLSDVIAASAALGSTTEAPPTLSTEARETQNQGRSTMLIALRASALASAATAAAETDFASADDADNILRSLSDALGDLSDLDVNGVEPDQDMYDAIRDLLGAVTDHLKQVAGTLAEVTTHRTHDVLPALVIAYQLYGDATRDDEILERNSLIAHPSFVPALEDLEILTP